MILVEIMETKQRHQNPSTVGGLLEVTPIGPIGIFVRVPGNILGILSFWGGGFNMFQGFFLKFNPKPMGVAMIPHLTTAPMFPLGWLKHVETTIKKANVLTTSVTSSGFV